MPETSKAPPGKANLIVTAAVLTVLAAVGGGLVGKLIGGKLHAAASAPGVAPAAEPAKAAPYSGDTELRELPPIIANLADPSEARVRLQIAIVYSKKAVELPNILAAQISDDVLGYVKTLTVTQLQGASGLQALREDLQDRAVARSSGRVREVMIENLVVQ